MIHKVAAFAINTVEGIWYQTNSIRDCDTNAYGFRRLFCDLHCIRDSVLQGHHAKLDTIIKSLTVLQTNVDMLLEHYTGSVFDSLGEYQIAAEAAVGASGGSLLEQIRTLKSRFYGNVAEMKDMLTGNLRPEGYETATRAINAFNARWTHLHPNVNQSKAMGA